MLGLWSFLSISILLYPYVDFHCVSPLRILVRTQHIHYALVESTHQPRNWFNNLQIRVHHALKEKFTDLQHLTDQHIADQQRAIIKNKLYPEATLREVRGKVLLELKAYDIPQHQIEYVSHYKNNFAGSVIQSISFRHISGK